MKKDEVIGKYIISLNNFSPENTLKKYKVWESSAKDGADSYETVKEDIYVEKVADIMQEKSDRYMLFIDSKKMKVKSWLNMVDFARSISLPNATNKPCWWCRSSFVTCPIGAPINFWSKSSSSIHRSAAIKKCQDLNIKVDDDFEFFETEGIFCSFPCVKAYILSNIKNPRYKECLTNLILLFNSIHKCVKHIPIAPSWKVLEQWGGHQTIEQYRSSFDRLIYEDTNNIMRPIMFPVSTIYEEHVVR